MGNDQLIPPLGAQRLVAFERSGLHCRSAAAIVTANQLWISAEI